MGIHRDLSGQNVVDPISISEIVLYTDSICSLHWLHASSARLDKMQKRCFRT